MKKFLITNSVPLNGGDEALLRALVMSVAQRWPGSQISVLCKDLSRCRQQLPDLDLAHDLEFAETRKAREQILEKYRSADVVLSAPGGFLHDFYSVEQRLRGFETAIGLGKPLILVGQSIGPFWKSESMRRVRQALNRVSAICVRDEISAEHLSRCGVDRSKVKITADVAFLWHRLANDLFQPAEGGDARLIGLSFRVWPLGDRSVVQDTISKAVRLCEHLLSGYERRILFLSTCQGVPGYVDDAEIAAQILDRLPSDLKHRCEIDASRYAPRELIQALGRCDAFIGMRLHACLLAILGGVPAMGLGYEDKTEQIFTQMNLRPYQVRFDTDADSWINATDRFLTDLSEIRGMLPQILKERCSAAEGNLESIGEQLSSTNGTHVTPEQRWSKAVSEYGRPHLRLRQVAALVNELKPKRMLDVGCATGHLRLLCPGVEYTGCDFIPPTPPIEFPFYQCNFNREPLPKELNHFDVVVGSGVLEYIENLPAFLTMLRSRLSAEGHLVLTYFNMNHISRVASLLLGRSFPTHPDWRGFYSPNTFRNAVEQSGLRITRIVAMNHALRPAVGVEQTVSAPLRLPTFRWWSPYLAHQILLVARAADS